jgi:NAD(P)-dependent dehydrogenase (short-subunit alcohol dehydrogenase family)
MRPLDEQTILITGATDGLGRALATELAAAGAALLIHGRNDARGQETIDDIAARTGNRHLHWLRADLASLGEVRDLAVRVTAEHPRVDVLVNNAGIGYTTEGDERRMESRDGYELRFAVNYLAGYLLTRLLLPHLHDSAPARIVNVASAGQAPIDFDDVMLERHYDGARAYRQSKLAQIMFTFDLADELDGGSVTANCLHPATYMPTKIVRDDGTEPVSSLDEGVRATLRLICDPGLDDVTGRYFNGTTEAGPHPQARDAAARHRLRDLSDRLCGLAPAAQDPSARHHAGGVAS